MTKKAKKKVLVVVNNHFDPIWRRCWNRRFTFGGQSFVSYAEIEDYYLTDNLELSRRIPDYKFEAESAVVLRKYLDRHPDTKAEFVRLAREGRFMVSGAGDNIIDSNLVLGESIIRNFLYGLLWVEKVLGRKTTMGVRIDAFGNSAQIPQIFRGCEIKWVTGLCYSEVKGEYFRGLDGSTVAAAALPLANGIPSAARRRQKVPGKLPPCGHCGGLGCKACRGRGIEDCRVTLPERLEIAPEAPVAILRLAPEERLPALNAGAWAAALRRDYDLEFALGEDAFSFLEDKIELVDNPPEELVHTGVELNPNNTGCYTTRIKLKQECRRLEYAVMELETLSCAARLLGKKYPMKELNDIWQRLLFTMFHDAITATHVDAAYDEIMAMNADIDRMLSRLRRKTLRTLVTDKAKKLTVINPRGSDFLGLAYTVAATGKPVALQDDSGRIIPPAQVEKQPDGQWKIGFPVGPIPPFGAKVFTVVRGKVPKTTKLEKPTIENARFRVVADTAGIMAVYDKKLKREISRASYCRPGELLVEHDEGSPWATLRVPAESLRLANYTLIEAIAGNGRQTLVFKGTLDAYTFAGSCNPLDVVTRVTLTEGIERIDFEVEVKRWDSYNSRLRIAFPVPFAGDDYYGIPYGTLRREVYEPTYSWAGANGDWPTIDWAGVEGDKVAAAVFNKGIPSYKIEREKQGKIIYISLLRSPTIPTYLHEPESYTMTAFDGMRDAGTHRFELALTAYAGNFAGSPVVTDAETYNAGVLAVSGEVTLPRLPRLEPGCARIAVLKMAEQGDALIVRIAEFRGRNGNIRLTLPEGVAVVRRVNMLERGGQGILPVENDRILLPVKPWEIITLRCELIKAGSQA